MSLSPNRNQTPSTAVASYTAMATKTLAHLINISKKAEQVHTHAHTLQNDAEQNRKIKLKLSDFKLQLNELCQGIQLDESLLKILQNPNQPIQQDSHQKAPEIYHFPQISLPEMGWVLTALDDINEQTFRLAEESIKKQKQSLLNTQNSLAKYSEKLKKVEEKLVKGYEQAKSKKRYL